MTTHRRAHVLATVAAGAVAVAGCSGQATTGRDDASPSSRRSTPTSTAPPTIPPQHKKMGVTSLKLGVMLPRTGDLTHLRSSLQAGVRLALADIRADGGVLGRRVRVVTRDSGDGRTGVAAQSARQLVRKRPAAVIGGVSWQSSVDLMDVLERRAARAEKKPGARRAPLMVSATDMSEAYDTFDSNGQAYRTVPSNALQAGVLAQQVAALQPNKHTRVVMLVSRDPDAQALARRLSDALAHAGVSVVAEVEYDPTLSQFRPEARETARTEADATVVVGSNESVRILRAMSSKKVGPQKRPVFCVDTNTIDYSTRPTRVKDSLQGMTGIEPGTRLAPEVLDRLQETAPTLQDPGAAPEAYDAVMLVALAAQQAGDTTPEAVAGQIVDVSADGRQCHGFQQCRVLIDRGVDVDYQGLSGPVDFNDSGSPRLATIGVMTYDSQNVPRASDYIEGEIR